MPWGPNPTAPPASLTVLRLPLAAGPCPPGTPPPAGAEPGDAGLQGRPGPQDVVGEAEQGGVERVVGSELLLGHAQPEVDVVPAGPVRPPAGPLQHVDARFDADQPARRADP